MILFVEVPQIDFVRPGETPSHEHRRVSCRRAELHAGRVLENTERRRPVRLSHDYQVSNLRMGICDWRQHRISTVLPSPRI